MHQPRSGSENHSSSLFATSLVVCPGIHFSRYSCWGSSSKYRCSESFTTGVPPHVVHLGLPSSSAPYVEPQRSQLSPYWFSAPHFGQTPFTKRSGRNMLQRSQ